VHFLYYLGAFFCIFYVFNKEDLLCAFFFDFCVFVKNICVHFLHFLLPPIVEVDMSDIAIISGMTNMVKAIILVINNTPQKTYRIAQYTDSWNRFHSLPTMRDCLEGLVLMI
jgi:hypothetical protein